MIPITADPSAAAAALSRGGLVGMPTETVYGLAAAIDQPAAVARVYAVKGRPANHPLIVHLADLAQLGRYAAEVPRYASAMLERCWPGPLTVVLRKTDLVGDFVTGGQPTVAIRMPDHRAALAMLRACRTGVAAPSANRFGRVSPTTAAHVAEELGDLLDPERDLILDGGPTTIGLESTIVDCTGPQPRLLRTGAVTADRIRELTGLPLAPPSSAVRAPGTLAAHYAPRARVVVREDAGPDEPGHGDPTRGLIAPCGIPTPLGVVRLLHPADEREYAAGLYAALREADALGLREVGVVLPAGEGLAAAIRDRVRRAAVGSGGQS